MSILGMNPEPVEVEPEVKLRAPGFWTIALAVLVGNVLTGILAALVYAGVTH